MRRGDHVVLLNSDTVVTPGWLEKLVVCAETQALEIGGAPVGVVGPLSNAASWQSIPECQTPAGWAVNELPPGVVLDEHAFRIAAGSMRLYPEVPLVNGFCYLITGAALAAVGMLDEIAFPRGYGEEDDYSIRLLDAGFRQRIADDCYVWHAKSKSFTAEGRAELIEDAKATRNEKHGSIRVRALNRELGANEDLLRARLCASLAAEAPAAKRDDLCSLGQGRSIAWLLPHLGVVGGVRRTIEMTGRLQGWGFDVTIYTPSGESADWLPIAASVASFAQLRGRTHDIAICTDPDIVDVFLELDARLPVLYHLHAYNRYRERNAGLDAYYGIGDGALHIANSAWTAEQIAEHCDVAQIIPGGISRKLFRPVRTRNQADIACYGSKRTRKGTHLIEKAGAGYELLKLEELNAAQEELAKHISSAFLFVSACEIEGFNFCPLEAMACGVPVVVTDDGGSREYARHDQNAIVVPEWGDPVSLRRAIERGIEDRELRSRLIEGGLKTAWGFTWDGVTADLADCLTTHLRARD
ncbi:MAG: GT2 family glycosyltransferase [Planctomycetota bacterium]